MPDGVNVKVLPATKSSVVLAAALVLGACASTLPSLRPFSNATEAMVSAIGSGYDQTQALLAQADPGGQQAADLEKAWETTSASLNAIAAYAGTLAQLAKPATRARRPELPWRTRSAVSPP